MSAVVSNWQRLRQRNIANAKRSEALEQELIAHYKQASVKIAYYEQLQVCIDTLPELTRSVQQLTQQAAQLYHDVNDLELARYKLMLQKNRYLITAHQQQKNDEIHKLHSQLTKEVVQTKEQVEKDRQKNISKAIETYKKQLQDEYESKLTALQQQPPISPNLPQATLVTSIDSIEVNIDENTGKTIVTRSQPVPIEDLETFFDDSTPANNNKTRKLQNQTKPLTPPDPEEERRKAERAEAFLNMFADGIPDFAGGDDPGEILEEQPTTADASPSEDPVQAVQESVVADDQTTPTPTPTPDDPIDDVVDNTTGENTDKKMKQKKIVKKKATSKTTKKSEQ